MPHCDAVSVVPRLEVVHRWEVVTDDYRVLQR